MSQIGRLLLGTEPMVVDWTIDYHVQPKLSDEFVTR